MKKILLGLASLVLIFGLMGSVGATGTTLYVDDDVICGGNTPCYSTIQAAINVANSGDTINVTVGTYDEQLLINGKDISLKGAVGVIIQPTTSELQLSKLAVIRINNATVTIEDFEINGNNRVALGVYDAIYAKGGTDDYPDSVDVTIRNNYIHNYNKNGITVNGALATATIEGNTVIGRGPLEIGDYAQNGIQLGYGAGGTITENTISNHHYLDDDWAATGILLYDVKAKMVDISAIKSENTFENNDYDMLWSIVSALFKGEFKNDEASL